MEDEVLDVDGHQVDAALGEFAEVGDVVHGHAVAGDADDFDLGRGSVDDLGESREPRPPTGADYWLGFALSAPLLK